MDIRRNNPASPRGRGGRSYRDLTAQRTASTPSSSASNSPVEKNIPLPDENDNGTKLTMRKAKDEGEFETAPMGLGLDRGVQEREKAE